MPVAATMPIPGSITTLLAFRDSQRNVVDCPALTVAGAALKVIVGAGGAGAVGAGGGGAGAGGAAGLGRLHEKERTATNASRIVTPRRAPRARLAGTIVWFVLVRFIFNESPCINMSFVVAPVGPPQSAAIEQPALYCLHFPLQTGNDRKEKPWGYAGMHG
jgi:hypothetical protein